METFEELQKDYLLLKAKFELAEKTLEEIVRWGDIADSWGDSLPEEYVKPTTHAYLCLKKIKAIEKS